MTELHTHRGVVTCAITNVYARIEACVMSNLDLKFQKLIGYKASMWPCDLMVPNGFMQDNRELKRSLFTSAPYQNNFRGKEHNLHESQTTEHGQDSIKKVNVCVSGT